MSIQLVMAPKHLILCHPLLPSASPSIRSFPVSRLFSSCSWSIGASVSASVLPMNIQCWFPLELTGFLSLQSKRLSRVFSNTVVQKHKFFSAHPFFRVQHSCLYITARKAIALTICTFVDKVMSLLSNMLSSFVIAFLPRSKCLLISWLQSWSHSDFGA